MIHTPTLARGDRPFIGSCESHQRLWNVAHACESPLSHRSRVSAELIPLRILLPCGIVPADLASWWRGVVRVRLRPDGRTGRLPE
jgi:hypothetical protein